MDKVEISLDPVMQGVLALILMFIMFSVALGLRVEHFRMVARAPGDVIKGLLVQVVALPAVTMVFVYLLSLPASIALGLIIVASCPGGNVSNFFCKLSHANVAYSVTLTALSSVVAVFMIPISILFWGGFYAPIADLLQSIDLDRGMFLARTVVLLGVPLFIGMAVAHKWPDLSDKIQQKALPASIVLLFALVLISLTNNADLILNYWPAIMGIVTGHNLLAFLLGGTVGRLLLSDRAKRRTLVFEVGLQNTGLGLVILLSQFKGIGGAALITATWGIWHLFTGLALAVFYRQRGEIND